MKQHEYIKNEVITFSSWIGNNFSLVQGAGGNISWKENNTLWIKASGTWLKDAMNKNIFIPLSLQKVNALILENESDFSSTILSNSTLRPSIETSLHALLPHKVVIHVHAIDILAHAVLKQGKDFFEKILSNYRWLWVEYIKPGIELTRKISSVMNQLQPPDILILGNHGLVVGADNVSQAKLLIEEIVSRCKILPRKSIEPSKENLNNLLILSLNTNYQLPKNIMLHSFGLDQKLLSLASNHWIMYPDQAVFLGPNAFIIDKMKLTSTFFQGLLLNPPCIIVPGEGILIKNDLTAAQEAMLACFLEVGLRIENPYTVKSLTQYEISDILNWDAEKYRQNLNPVNKF